MLGQVSGSGSSDYSVVLLALGIAGAVFTIWWMLSVLRELQQIRRSLDRDPSDKAQS